jgi:hypothetical protein
MAQGNLSLVAQYSRRKRHVFEHRDSGAFRTVVGVAAVSSILCQREAELAYRGGVEAHLTQNSFRTSRLQNARCRCESDEGLKVEIPN